VLIIYQRQRLSSHHRTKASQNFAHVIRTAAPTRITSLVAHSSHKLYRVSQKGSTCEKKRKSCKVRYVSPELSLLVFVQITKKVQQCLSKNVYIRIVMRKEAEPRGVGICIRRDVLYGYHRYTPINEQLLPNHV
jgi:hypothetical protein